MVPPNEEKGAGQPARRTPALHPRFEADVTYWHHTDPKLAQRLRRIVDAVLEDPFTGIAKPELLRGDHSGLWSRRLTREHRIIYRVTEREVEFLSARAHYS